jgi:hypothetical protein
MVQQPPQSQSLQVLGSAQTAVVVVARTRAVAVAVAVAVRSQPTGDRTRLDGQRSERSRSLSRCFCPSALARGGHGGSRTWGGGGEGALRCTGTRAARWERRKEPAPTRRAGPAGPASRRAERRDEEAALWRPAGGAKSHQQARERADSQQRPVTAAPRSGEWPALSKGILQRGMRTLVRAGSVRD